MARLDADDLRAIKNLLETTIDEVFERKELASIGGVGSLMTRDDLYKKVAEIKTYLSLPFNKRKRFK